MRGKRFLVYAYFAKNLGDDLFLKVLFDRYPNVRWDLLTANRNYNHIFKEYNNVNIIYSYRDVKIGKSSFNLFFKINEFLKYSRYDGFIIIGGSLFMQSPAWKMKKKEREYLLENFKRKNKPTYILGANFGPYKDPSFFREYKEMFREFNDVCFRDQYSFKLFMDQDHIRVAPDIIFGITPPTVQKEFKKIGISLINLKNRENLKEFQEGYVNKIVQIIEKYIHLGYKITLFSYCEIEGDLEIAKTVQFRVRDIYQGKIEIINYEGNIDDFLRRFSGCEIIIGTRFHSIILALLNNQPVYPIIYSDKTFNVLKDIGLEKEVTHIKDLEKIDAENVLTSAINNKLKSEGDIKEAENHFMKLDSFINVL